MSGSPRDRASNPFDEGPFKAAGDAPGVGARACDRPGCPLEGVHRAPRSRDDLNSYFWFCLEHVREYNAAWDYFKDLDEDGIEQIRRRDAVWQRPTWPLNSMGKGGKANKDRSGPYSRPFRDPFDFFEEQGPEAARAATKGRFPPGSREAKALRTLDLAPDADFAAVKTRYKALAKALHPDVTGGDGHAEERLKIINLAYSDLKAAFE